MKKSSDRKGSRMLVMVAFAVVYIVWGSTYFFIKVALHDFPPMLLGALRYSAAGLLLLGWCILKGKKIIHSKSMITSAVVGLLLLVCGNGAVILGQKTLASAIVAILWASQPLSFVLLDKQNWGSNLKNRTTVAGLLVGFSGIILLFSDQLNTLVIGNQLHLYTTGMFLVIGGTIAFSAGSLYSKHHPTQGSPAVNIAWQMLMAGLVFLTVSWFNHEWQQVRWSQIMVQSWLALIYLIIFGSIAAFSAYIWLLNARPATQVSTYAYVNPVVAVVIGVVFGQEHISFWQCIGLVAILSSVLLINFSKYRKSNAARDTGGRERLARTGKCSIVSNKRDLENCGNQSWS